MSGLIDIVAYTYHVLLFYLNQTASDSTFSQAELFENMNKIISLIQYKPNGNYSSSLNVSVVAKSTIPAPNSYTIPRFAYFYIRNIVYSFNSDITFQKYTNLDETIQSIGDNHLLYQGIFKEYPIYTAIGEDFEQFTINIDYPVDLQPNKMVDNNQIYMFVKDYNSQTWIEWKEISSLYLADDVSNVFEKRVNEYGHTEVKVGNNINGKRLNAGDTIAFYYLESDGEAGIVGPNYSKEGVLLLYNTQQFSEIFNDINDPTINYITSDLVKELKFDNQYDAIPYKTIETVDDIRKNAPLLFSTQNRAVTNYDYEAFLNKYFSNIIHDVKVVTNKRYVSEYLAYYYDLGLEKPNLDDKLLFNQVSFNDACDFNNVYFFCVPRLGAIMNETTPIELFYSQKQSIVDKFEDIKMTSHNIVINDPIYLAFEIGLPITGETITTSIKDETVIRIKRNQNQLLSKDQIKKSVFSVVKDFFNQNNNTLGKLLDFTSLSFNILNINGVASLETVRKNNNVEYKLPKLNFLYWNPLYNTSTVYSTGQNISLKFFEFPFFYQISNLINKIEVI
jgi:hypothetical protein